MWLLVAVSVLQLYGIWEVVGHERDPATAQRFNHLNPSINSSLLLPFRVVLIKDAGRGGASADCPVAPEVTAINC